MEMVQDGSISSKCGAKGIYAQLYAYLKKIVLVFGQILAQSDTQSHKPMFFISRRALAREGDYEMMSVCACVRVCVR